MASIDYVNQEIKGLMKSFDTGTNIMVDKLKNIPCYSIQGTDEYTQLLTSTESVSGFRETGEQETPDVVKLGDGAPVTLVSKRFADAIIVTETDRVKMGDSSTKVREFLTRQQARVLKSANYKMASELARFFNEAFTSTSDLVAPDGVELCGTHTWNSTGATFVNEGTEALDETAVDNVMEFGGAFTDAEGLAMPQDYNVIVVKKGSAAARQAKKLFAEHIVPTAVNDVNIYEGQFTIIELPLITSANKNFWFMMDLHTEDSPLGMYLLQAPQLKEPIKLENESIRTNCTAFWSQGILRLPYNVFGSNGTT